MVYILYYREPAAPEALVWVGSRDQMRQQFAEHYAGGPPFGDLVEEIEESWEILENEGELALPTLSYDLIDVEECKTRVLYVVYSDLNDVIWSCDFYDLKSLFLEHLRESMEESPVLQRSLERMLKERDVYYDLTEIGVLETLDRRYFFEAFEY